MSVDTTPEAKVTYDLRIRMRGGGETITFRLAESDAIDQAFMWMNEWLAGRKPSSWVGLGFAAAIDMSEVTAFWMVENRE